MSDQEWEFPEELQPRAEDVNFDLDVALDAVVILRSQVPDHAYTASGLGTERIGNGIVIDDDGLVLTIGYLIAEANHIWLTSNSGITVAAYPLAYDQITGFGLVRAIEPLKTTVLQRGSTNSCERGDQVFLISQGGCGHALKANVIDKREFAGYWEYYLSEALFTAPAHPQWGGAALIGKDGDLLGVGSLLVEEVIEGQKIQGNMLVPIDLLNDSLAHLLATGRSSADPRPWLGMFTMEHKGRLVVTGVAANGPGANAGIRKGDIVVEVAGKGVSTLSGLLQTVWKLGPVGVTVPVTLSRKSQLIHYDIKSADRGDFLIKPVLH